MIIPSKKSKTPIAPSFFLEVKSSEGKPAVAKRQVTLDGAYGAHMMNSLENYLVKERRYDGKAYAFSAVLIDGLFELYAHHLTAPVKPRQRPDYYITRLKSHSLNDEEGYSKGREGLGI